MNRSVREIVVPIFCAFLATLLFAQPSPKTLAAQSNMEMPQTSSENPAITAAAIEVLALQQKIEAATVSGDIAFAETVLSRDFHFRHGDGWTRGEKSGGIEDDRDAFLKRIADKEYLVHDLDQPKIEMHGDIAITWGRYVSLFVPKNRSNATPPGLTSIWFERVWAKRNGCWQWLSHRTVWGPHPAPAGVDPTQVTASQAASYVPGLPEAKAPAETTKPESKEAAEILALDEEFAAAVVAGDQIFFENNTSDDFRMWHGDIWTRGGTSPLIDTKQTFSERIRNRQYQEWHFDSVQAEMHGDIAITFGRYAATLKGSNPDRAWFAVWFERIYQKRNDRWIFISQRTVHGASYGPTRASVSEK
jgi:hypothetical protein